MKSVKFTMLAILGAITIAAIAHACAKDIAKITKSLLSDIVQVYNKGVVFEQDQAIFLEGEMSVVTLPSNEILFFLTSPGKQTKDIFLAQCKDTPSPLDESLGKVSVAYLRTALVIENNKGKLFTYTIGEGKGNEIVQNLSPVWRGIGFGLAHWYNRIESPSDYKGLASTDDLYRNLRSTPSECKCRAFVLPIEANDDSDCTSGGVGSIGCSIATVGNTPGCTVSCSSAYWACCKAGTE